MVDNLLAERILDVGSELDMLGNILASCATQEAINRQDELMKEYAVLSKIQSYNLIKVVEVLH